MCYVSSSVHVYTKSMVTRMELVLLPGNEASISCTRMHTIVYIQVNKKFCELKGGNIGIVEKAQETRFGMSPKYSRYIGIAS